MPGKPLANRYREMSEFEISRKVWYHFILRENVKKYTYIGVLPCLKNTKLER